MMETTKPFLQTLRGQALPAVPFWFMRQAGRYLPEYRALRAQKNGFLSMVMDPAAAAEVTLQPLRRFGMDAAILFSDILVVPLALGQHLEFLEGEGPKLAPVRDGAAIAALDYEAFKNRLEPIYETVSRVRSGLVSEGMERSALIGFAGSPWTVAAYMIEGQGSKDFFHARRMEYADRKNFAALIDIITDATIDYLLRQIEAGAEALQIFDSWAGLADARQFEDWVIAPSKKITDAIHVKHPQVPVIGFPRGAGVNYKSYVQQTGVDAVGLDSSLPPRWAAQNLQTEMPVQGNLDPLALLAGGDALDKSVDAILQDLLGGPFIFNLGHGIHKDTPIAHVQAMCDRVKAFRR